MQSSLLFTQELFSDIKVESLSSFISKGVIKKYQILFDEKSQDQRIRFVFRIMSNHELTDDQQTINRRLEIENAIASDKISHATQRC